MPSHRRVGPVVDPAKALTSAIAMDVGKEMVAYLEVMYPDVFAVMNGGCKLSIRNHIHNDIIAAMEIAGAANHMERLRERAAQRREWVGMYRAMGRRRAAGGDAETGCADDQTFADAPADALRAATNRLRLTSQEKT